MLYGEIITTVEPDERHITSDWFLPSTRSWHWERLEQGCSYDSFVDRIRDGEVELDLPAGYRLHNDGDIDISEYRGTDRDMFLLEKFTATVDPRQMTLRPADCDCDVPAFGYICDSCEIPD